LCCNNATKAILTYFAVQKQIQAIAKIRAE